MTVHNAEIADKFNQLADLLEIEDANPFRVRAYRNAARIIDGLPHEVADMLKDGKDLTKIPNIGKDLAEKIKTIVKTGELPLLQEIQQETPAALSEMMLIPSLGPKRVKQLYKELKIKSMSDLKKALESGKVSKLDGFGDKTQDKIKQALEKFEGAEKRTLLARAEKFATTLVKDLKAIKGVDKVIVAGSFRRRKETVGDLDILVTAKNGKSVIDAFTKFDDIGEVVSKGKTRSTVKLKSGLQVDLRVVKAKSYGAALHYFTGSKAHNIKVRKMAQKKKLKINEYGVFKGDKQIAGKTEKEVYKTVGLPYFEPELREDTGEIEAAQKKKLPTLIELQDIKGDLHSHTDATDGHDTLNAMAKKAKDLGYKYLAITDHSQHLTVANGLTKKRLLAQIKKIDKLNEKFSGFRILKAIECDILADGKLDLPDDVLKELDLTVCSVHYKFDLSRKKQTERILRAMDNPYFNILAHPTGRLINSRDPYDVDLEKIIEQAKQNGCFLELNAQPERMDLTDHHCRMAKEMGVKLAISTDSHSINNLDNMLFGISQARRAWLSKDDVINTRSWRDLKQLLRRN